MIIDIPDATIDQLLDDIMQNYPDYSFGNALKCVDWHYEGFRYVFIDTENKTKQFVLTLPVAREGFKKLLDHMATKPDEIISFNPFDAGSYDCGLTDTFVQFCLLGELVYG